MGFIQDDQEIYDIYTEGRQESKIWREDYHEYERLADNGLIDGLDQTLPEVNDGSLSASLYKLPKRIVSSNLKGRARSTDRDEAWLTELANIVWEEKIIPNANSQAPFIRKWKDAVRKAAIYGSVPIITLFTERGDYTGSDFIVVQPQDVTLEPGKVSDYDSDIIFWDVYYTKQQVKDMIEEAKEGMKAKKAEDGEAYEENSDGYNKWNIKALKEILKNNEETQRDPRDDYRQEDNNANRKKGINFCVVFQRGVDAPFYMYHKDTKKTVREWTNQDPTGDMPIHFLYCYQDFVNPYGVGIVKLAGGTQNVLDYMRQADVLATQLGFRPPVSISGNIDNVDLNSIVYEQDAIWEVGDATVKREEISNQVYSQLPGRISMYKTSLDQLLPTGDTSISATAGDPNYSKTPAGIKFQQANLSIDDEDFKDNLYMTYEAVAKSMINIQFANMQGSDLMKLSDEDRDLLIQSGLEFPQDEDGNPTNELEILWDDARSTFNFEIEADADKTKDEEKRLEGLLRVLELVRSDPTMAQELMISGKKLNTGELLATIISLTTDNDKIIDDISPEDMQAQQMQQEQMQLPQGQPEQGMPQEMPQEAPQQGADPQMLQEVMQAYGVDEGTAMAMMAAEEQGFEPEEILAYLEKSNQQGAM